MTGPKSAKSSAKGNALTTKSNAKEGAEHTSQIEYLLHQSTQGLHFMFSNRDIAKIMKNPVPSDEFYSTENMEKVQNLLTDFLDFPSLDAKKVYLERLPETDFELLVRAYFQLVENTILAHSTVRH
jgi:hypothetical protein